MKAETRGANEFEDIDICRECGTLCCKLGGAVATETEYLAIVEAGHDDYFVKITDGVYITEWIRPDGVCPYLDDDACSIYSVRPLGCRLFPVVHIKDKGPHLVHCRLSENLTKVEIRDRVSLLTSRPDTVARAATEYRARHGQVLKMKLSRFKVEELTPPSS